MSKKNIGGKFFNIFLIIVLSIIICNLFVVYKKHGYNNFIKAEREFGLTTFIRDKENTYNYEYSYKLENKEFNDAIFYKDIKLEKNTPYKLTCMVKTKDIITENGKQNGGAQISIADTTESSKSIVGTNEWQKLELFFDSKEREEIELGFRLGGAQTNAKGTAWFSDFKLEKGIKDESNNWNMACFIIENVDVNINNENIKLSMSLNDKQTMKENMERFKEAAYELSDEKMVVDYDVYEISEPVTTVTYSEEFAYHLDPSDVQEIIRPYLEEEQYDYIFVAVRLGDVTENIEIPVQDWIGLRRYGFRRNTDIQT